MNIKNLREVESNLKAFRDNVQKKADDLVTHEDLREHLAGEALKDAADFVHRAIRHLEVEEEEKECRSLNE